MCQKNLKTDFERPVRFCIADTNNESSDSEDSDEDKNTCWSYWTWLDDIKSWITYSPYTSIELETNYQKYTNKNNSNNPRRSNSVKIQINKTTYTVDFKRMEQTNDRTKYGRKIKRVISDATNVKAEQNENQMSSKSGQKRKSLSTASTISVKSEPEEVNDENKNSAGNTNKRLKKIRDQLADQVDVKTESQDSVELVEETVEVKVNIKRKLSTKTEVKSESEEKPAPRTSTRSGRAIKSVQYKEDASFEDKNDLDDSYNSKNAKNEENDEEEKDPDDQNDEEDEPPKKKYGSGAKKKPAKSIAKKEEPEEMSKLLENYHLKSDHFF
jgi:hypothetical protein